MTEAAPQQSILVLAFESIPRVRILNYVEYMAEQGHSIDFVVWDEERWRDPEVEPPIPASVRVHELRTGERALPTQQVKRFFMYWAPGGVLHVLMRAVDSNPVTRPLKPVVDFAGKVHRGVTRILERLIFRNYNRFGRPHRIARVADEVLQDKVDFNNVGRIVSAESYSVTYAWHLAKRLPNVPVTVSLDRKPLTPANA